MAELIDESKVTVGEALAEKPVQMDKSENKRLPTTDECDKLVTAAMHGDMEVISTLINDGIDMNGVVLKEKCTPLYTAAEHGHNDVVMLLLAANANPNCVCTDQCTPLYIASFKGFIEVVRSLIAANADVNCVCFEKCTPLYTAAEHGHNDVVMLLLGANANPNCVCTDQCTPLYIASLRGFSEVVKSLLAVNADVNCVCTEKCTPLYTAAEHGHNDVVMLLLAANANPNCVCIEKCTPLYTAAEYGHNDVVMLLLAANANPNCICNNQCTPLYAASFKGFSEVVRSLLAANADVNCVCFKKCTPLYTAADHGHNDVLKLLLAANANPNCICTDQCTPLYVASFKGFSEVVKSLIEANADLNCVCFEKCTPLYTAAEHGHNDVVKLLLAANANPNCICTDRCTPLYIASLRGFSEVVKSLLVAKADVNCVCFDQCTPLYAASAVGFNEGVKSLIAANADVNCVCKHQLTPLHIATYQGHYDVVKTLMEANADKDLLNEKGITPFRCAVDMERSKIVKYFVEEIKVDTTLYDQPFQQRIAYLLDLEAAIERSKIETKIQGVQSRTTAVPGLTKSADNLTLEKVNKSYMDGCLPIVDPRVVLLGCEGSGKTSLIDTFLGNSFRNTSPTEGADQMEVCVTTAANWKIMNEDEKIADLKKQSLLESEFFLSLKELCESLEVPLAAQPPSLATSSTLPAQQTLASATTPIIPTPSISTDEPSPSSIKRDAMAEPPKSLPQIPLNPRPLPGKLQKKFVYITKKEFQELKAMKEKYNPKRRYVHLWDFAGQQIFQHMHGLFVSEDVVCLIVFNAGKSLFTVPDQRYPHDITPAKSAIKIICYYMEMISARVSKRSTEGDDLSEFLPTFILIGTHIDELHSDVKVAVKLAFQHFVPALTKELSSKPFAKHIAGSKNSQLFSEGSCSIFFISNKDEMRDPLVVGKIKRVIFKAASITKQSRPIRLVEMERKFMLLAHQDKMSVIDKGLAKEVAESCGLSCTDQELVSILNYFHQKGILIHFHKVPALSNMIILSPQWLAKLLTYVLTTLKCQPVGPPFEFFVQKLQTTGLLEEELLEWSVQQFIMDEAARGNKMVNLVGSNVADLLINFKLMANVSNTSMAGQSPRVPGKNLFLVPHLLPKEEFVHSKAFGYHFFYYFPAKFIPEHLVDQLIVKCAEWNRSKQYDILKLSYQWVCLELGKHQIYELDVMFDYSVISMKIIPDPNLSSEAKEKGFAESNELVRSVQGFIDDLMKEHMAATFAKAPVVCYVPCPQCKKMHLSVEKASEKSSTYCPVSRVHADITDYHQILSAHQSDRHEIHSPGGTETTLLSASTDHNKSQSCRSSAASFISPDDGNTIEEEPNMKHLHQLVIPNVAAEWKTVADYLEFKLPVIKIIEVQCKDDPVRCCTELFRQWLSSDYGVGPKTWSTLIKILKEIGKLSMVTKEIELKLNSQQRTAQSHHDDELSSIETAPKMKHLNKYVIPKIADDWKRVADSLEFDIYTIRKIERKFSNNLESCDEMMRDWLSTDIGVKPKVWSTLIAALKDVKQLTASVEEIEQDIKCIL